MLTVLHMNFQFENKNFNSAILRAVILGLGMAIVGASLTWFISLFVSPEKFGPLAGARLFEQGKMFWIVLVAVVWAPIFETIVGQWLPIFLARYITESTVVHVCLSALVFSLGHVLGGGGWGQALMTAIYGTVLASFYVANFPLGTAKAIVVTAIAHCMNNAVMLSAALLWDSLSGTM